MKKTKLSVIVVTWDRFECTKNCLESLYFTTQDIDTEIIVVDNGSKDGTKNFLKQQVKQGKIDKFISWQKNKGFGKAFNRAMEEINGQYVLCLDNDMILLDGWFDEALKSFKKDQKLAQFGLLTNPSPRKIKKGRLDYGAPNVAGAWVSPKRLIKNLKWCEKLWDKEPWQAKLFSKQLKDKGYKTANTTEKLCIDLAVGNHKANEKYYRKTFKDRKIEGKLEMLLREEEDAKKKKVKKSKNLIEKTKTKKPHLSIITVNWNGLEYLKLCVNSIIKWTEDFELIIVDNNSSEAGTEDYLKQLSDDFSNIKVVMLADNGGWVGGINKGLEFVDGEYICFMNNDIEVFQGWFQQMQEHFKMEGDNTGIVGPVSDFTMGLQKADLNDQIEGNHHKVNMLIGWLLLTNRATLEAIAKHEVDKDLTPINKMAGLDPIFGLGSSDDLDISLRATKAGFDLFIAREVYVKHHGSKSYEKMFGDDLNKEGTEANKNYMADVENKIQILRKKWGNKEVDNLLGVKRKDQFRGTIGIPHGELIPHKFHTDLLSLQGLENIKLAHVYGSLVQKARNDIVTGMSGDWLLFIDSDMTFPADSLIRLLKHAERDDVDIVAGAFTRKVPNYEPCFFYKIPDNSPGYYQPYEWPEKELFEVDAVGSAFTLIKRKVFDTIPFPWYEYTNFISEDLNFCRKAKDHGFRIWVDPTLVIGHLALLPVDVNIFKQYNKKTIDEYEKQRKEKNGKCPIVEGHKDRLNLLKN